MKKILLGAVALAAFAVPATANAAYVYVGKWAVADGPLWSSNPAPQSLSGREAAALIFGGSASDYAISTLGADVSNINFKAFLDGYGDTQYLTNAQSQDFKGVAGSSYADGFGNYSAYVFDHACGVYYCDNGGGDLAINYAFKNSGAVPEPAAWAMMLAGFGLVGSAMRRREKVAVTFA